MAWCNCNCNINGDPCTCKSRQMYDTVQETDCPCNSQSIQEIQNCPCNSQNTCTCNKDCTANASNWNTGVGITAVMMNDIQTRIENMATVHKYTIPSDWKKRYSKGQRLLLDNIRHTRDEINTIINNTKSKFNVDFNSSDLTYSSPLKASDMRAMYEKVNYMNKWCICNGYVENVGACTCNTRCSCNTNCTCNTRCSCNSQCSCNTNCSCNCNSKCNCNSYSCSDCCNNS